MLSSDVGPSETELEFRKEIEEVYTGDTWQDCCDSATDNWDYDLSLFPKDDNGSFGATRKDLINVKQKVDLNWEDFSEDQADKIIEYYDDLWGQKMMAG